ncbi:MAG: glycosyltransferase family A protein [Acidimicrobiales bacterium]
MAPAVSVVVVAYDMARELPRTLHTLDPRRQVGVDGGDYEVVLVDNGSPTPVDPDVLARFSGRLELIRLDPAPPSPARAANEGVRAASGDLVGLVVDGARLCSPGLVATARLAAALASRPVVTAPAWHLGPVPHMRAAEVGYDQAAEDELLATTGWEDDAYELFGVSTFAGSSWRGIFGPMGESSSLFLPPSLWEELGGLDERFDLPGGGLVNHDLYRRATELPGVRLVELLGEGTFHQFHGGAATSRRFGWPEMAAGYEALRGEPYRPPTARPLYLGSVPPAYLPHVERSARLAIDGFPKPS